MRVSQHQFTDGHWAPPLPDTSNAQLLLTFAGRQLVEELNLHSQLAGHFPLAQHIGCTTSGEIFNQDVYDETAVLTAIEFEHTSLHIRRASLAECNDDSHALGETLAAALPHEGLRYVLVLSDGQEVNGSSLVAGIAAVLPAKTPFSGGLAGDGERFEKTLVWHNDVTASGMALVCGFYGDRLQVGHGSLGGWTAFGPEREITKSHGNVLYELDNQPALDLYKRYLGQFSEQLPASALRFPLNLTLPGESQPVVRTVLSIDEQAQSMTFAGDLPHGATVQLMKATFEAIIDGADDCAKVAAASLGPGKADLAILVSCVGRRVLLGQRIFEELDAVAEVLGPSCPRCGFYSYGEISPQQHTGDCRLHNQTMTICLLTERE